MRTIGDLVAAHLPAFEFAREVANRFVLPPIQGQRRRIVAVYLDPSNFKNIGDGHTIFDSVMLLRSRYPRIPKPTGFTLHPKCGATFNHSRSCLDNNPRLLCAVCGLRDGAPKGVPRSWTEQDILGPLRRDSYSLNTNGGPLTRFPLRSTVTSTRSAILMKGMPLFIP